MAFSQDYADCSLCHKYDESQASENGHKQGHGAQIPVSSTDTLVPLPQLHDHLMMEGKGQVWFMMYLVLLSRYKLEILTAGTDLDDSPAYPLWVEEEVSEVRKSMDPWTVVDDWLLGQEPGKRKMRKLRTRRSEEEEPAGGEATQ